MEYVVESRLPFSAAQIWKVLADVTHFARNDPYHRDFRFVGDQREGVGTTFTVKHTYRPIYPFGEETVTGVITQWEPEKRVLLSERCKMSFRNHSQLFTLEAVDAETTIARFSIRYAGVPLVLLGWKLWADYKVKARMADKLRELEDDCRTLAAAPRDRRTA